MVPIGYLVLYLVFIQQHLHSRFEGWLFQLFTLVHALSVVFILSTFTHAALTKMDEVVRLTIYVFGVYQGMLCI